MQNLLHKGGEEGELFYVTVVVKRLIGQGTTALKLLLFRSEFSMV